jgi:hypothetical protein
MKIPRDARILAALILGFAVLCSLPIVLRAAAPGWWASGGIYRSGNEEPLNPVDFSAVNQGQLKNVAVGAYEHLVTTIPSTLGTIAKDPTGAVLPTGVELMQLISQWVEIDYNFTTNEGTGKVLRRVLVDGVPSEPPVYEIDAIGPRKPTANSASHNDFTAVSQGQLKSVAKRFYNRLDTLYSPFPYPAAWTAAQEDDAHYALVNLGQVKRMFAFDLDGDSDGDRVSDIMELSRIHNDVRSATNPFSNSDSDGDGMADDWELVWNLNPAAADASNLQVGMGSTAIQMYESGTLPDSAAPPDSVDWTPIRRVSLRQQQVSENGQEFDLLTWDTSPSLTGNVTIEREIEDDVWIAVHTAAVQAGEARIPSFDRSNSQYLEKLSKGIVPSYSEAFNHRLKGAVTSNESIVQVRLKVCRVGNDISQPGFVEFSSNPTKYYLKFTETYSGPGVSGNAHGTVNVAARTLVTGLTYTDEEDTDHADATMTWPAPAKLEDPVEGASISETISGGGNYDWINNAGDVKHDGTHDAIHTRTWKRRSQDNVEVSYEDWELKSSSGSETTNIWVHEDNDWVASSIDKYKITSTTEGTLDHSERPDWVPEITEQGWDWVCLVPSWSGNTFHANLAGTVNTGRNTRTDTWGLNQAWTHVVSLSNEFTGAQLHAYAIGLLPELTEIAYAGYAVRRNTGSTPERDRFEPRWLSRETQFLPRTTGLSDLNYLSYEISERNLRSGNGSIELARGTYYMECNDCLPSGPVTVAEVEYAAGAPSSGQLIRTLSLTPGSRPGKAIKTGVVTSDVTASASNVSRFLSTVGSALGVDANRNGTITFDGNDQTTPLNPFRFWLNNDEDVPQALPPHGREVTPPRVADNRDFSIRYSRDLEDFTRIAISVQGLTDLVLNGTVKIGLQFKDVSGNPVVNIWPNSTSSGSDGYLRDIAQAEVQKNAGEQLFMANYRRVSAQGVTILPTTFWQQQAANQGNPYGHLIFEGVSKGGGRLALTIHNAQGIEIGEAGSVWIKLMHVKAMYERTKATPENGFDDDFRKHTSNAFSFPSVGTVPDPFNEPFDKPPDETSEAVVLVHGWNMSYHDYETFSATFFKRLWHQGFKGRFCTLRWPTHTALDSYNRSELRAWKYGPALKLLVDSLPGDYAVTVAAHSMGNILTSAALNSGMVINNYVLMEGAIPAGCFDASNEVNNFQDFHDANAVKPTPDLANPDLGYRGAVLANNGARLINFFNRVDYATTRGDAPYVGWVPGVGKVGWEINEISYKPDHASNALPIYYKYDSSEEFSKRRQLRNPYFTSAPADRRYISDHHETMSFIARPLSKAVGAREGVDGLIDEEWDLQEHLEFGNTRMDHSGQFNRDIQEVWEFYRYLCSRAGLSMREFQ